MFIKRVALIFASLFMIYLSSLDESVRYGYVQMFSVILGVMFYLNKIKNDVIYYFFFTSVVLGLISGVDIFLISLIFLVYSLFLLFRDFWHRKHKRQQRI